jgi:hypothetical protein
LRSDSSIGRITGSVIGDERALSPPPNAPSPAA